MSIVADYSVHRMIARPTTSHVGLFGVYDVGSHVINKLLYNLHMVFNLCVFH